VLFIHLNVILKLFQLLKGNLLEVPKTEKESEHYVTSGGLLVGSSAMQGWRLEMEDSHLSIDMPSRPDHTFFAVFDGYKHNNLQLSIPQIFE
jgi:hypothetical protein